MLPNRLGRRLPMWAGCCVILLLAAGVAHEGCVGCYSSRCSVSQAGAKNLMAA